MPSRNSRTTRDEFYQASLVPLVEFRASLSLEGGADVSAGAGRDPAFAACSAAAENRGGLDHRKPANAPSCGVVRILILDGAPGVRRRPACRHNASDVHPG